MKQMEEEKKQQAEKIYNVDNVTNMYVENLILQKPSVPELPTSSSRKSYITDQKKTRYILDDYDDEDELESYPDKFCILSLYFFTLAYNQEYYAMLESGVNWSVPFTLAQLDRKDIRTVKEIKSMFSETIPNLADKLSILETGLFGNLEIECKGIEKGREYIEYEDGTCNYVREFFAKGVNPAGEINLADPECLHKHRYVGFALLDKLPRVEGLTSFMDKPIPDSVADVLLYEKRRLIKNSIIISRDDLVYQLDGILFIITLMNNKKLISPSHMLSSVLDQAMIFGNIGRYCIDGANVIGCVPNKKYDFTDLLCRMYEGLSKIHPELTLCCTVLCCKCEYGKIYGLSDLIPSFRLPECFLSHDLGSAQAWEHTEKTPGILFGWDMRDNDKITFAPNGARVFKPTDYKEENRTMNFIIWKKDKPETQNKSRKGVWNIVE